MEKGKLVLSKNTLTIGPMIFISVIAGITNMSNAADVGRMGGKLIVFSLAKLFCCTVVAVVFGLLFFAEGLPGLAEVIPQQALVTKPGMSLLDIDAGGFDGEVSPLLANPSFK